jgi:hypothetical protein
MDGQSCSNEYNYTNTITGTYTSAISTQTYQTFYVAPNTTVTGNIDLNHGQLLNCGTIINKKIRLKNVTDHLKGSLDNRGTIVTDTLLVDTLGDLHNQGSFSCAYLSTNLKGYVLNKNLLNVATALVKDSASLYNYQPYCKIIGKDIRVINGSWSTNMGLIYAEDYFFHGSGCIMNQHCTIEVDSMFRNAGYINGWYSGAMVSAILVERKSENSGTLERLIFCDHSTINGGGPDINTGQLIQIINCTLEPDCAKYNWVGLEENRETFGTLAIFPNPVRDRLNIQFTSKLNSVTASVYDPLGRLLFFRDIDPNNASVDLSSLTSGLYLIKFADKTHSRTFKVIKE